jgi:hypothetical protein
MRIEKIVGTWGGGGGGINPTSIENHHLSPRGFSAGFHWHHCHCAPNTALRPAGLYLRAQSPVARGHKIADERAEAEEKTRGGRPEGRFASHPLPLPRRLAILIAPSPRPRPRRGRLALTLSRSALHKNLTQALMPPSSVLQMSPLLLHVQALCSTRARIKSVAGRALFSLLLGKFPISV